MPGTSQNRVDCDCNADGEPDDLNGGKCKDKYCHADGICRSKGETTNNPPKISEVKYVVRITGQEDKVYPVTEKATESVFTQNAIVTLRITIEDEKLKTLSVKKNNNQVIKMSTEVNGKPGGTFNSTDLNLPTGETSITIKTTDIDDQPDTFEFTIIGK